MASPSPPDAPTSTASGPSANTGDAAPAGAFAKRFPRLTSTFQRYSSSRAARLSTKAWSKRRPIFFGLAFSYGALSYLVFKRDEAVRDFIHPDSWLVLKVYPGSIVEARKSTNLMTLLSSSSPGEDTPPKVMELYEVCQALKFAMKDDRIRGIFADFGGLHIPSSVAPEPLGMAQLEELVETIVSFLWGALFLYRVDTYPLNFLQHEFKLEKRQQYYLNQSDQQKETPAITESEETDESLDPEFKAAMMEENEKTVTIVNTDKDTLEKLEKEIPKAPVTTIAWADSFDSQGSYLLASAFDQVYLQPSGEVPLTGVTMQIPFVKRALDWLGIRVYAEARREFKSMVSTFTQTDGLPPAQLEDESRLLGELSRGLAHAIGVNRFPDMEPEDAADRVMELTRRGPFSAVDALKEGLISGVKYKSEVLKELGEEPKMKSFPSYSRILNQALDRKLSAEEWDNVAVVYLQGTISNTPGDFTASSVIKGLREAGEDETVSSIVLRIDSGGGDVVASDSIWDAVRRVQIDYKKPVIASFGNASASGGYYASAGADAILACESTITGSIGVASLRPTFTKKLFDRAGVTLQTLFTGSKINSSIHEMTPEEKEKHSLHIDQTYDTFLEKVCTGRKISKDVIEELAGGRVWTGLAAWIRCNPEKELIKGEEVEGQVNDGSSNDNESRKAKSWKANSSGKVISLASDWKTIDVTREAEMSTYRIDAVPSSSTQNRGRSAAADKGQEDEEEILKREILAEFANEEKEVPEVNGRGIVAQSVNEIESQDEESKLAAAAHEAAEASLRENKKAEEAVIEAEEKPLGPYGRGLIDSIGGITDASYLALALALQREIEELVQGGMTLEQAKSSVRPGRQREIGPDGNLILDANLRLIKYPKEKNWRERYREIQKNEERPKLSLLPGFGNIGLQMREFFTNVAIQVLKKSWRDPALIQRMISEVENERRIKMEYQPSMRM